MGLTQEGKSLIRDAKNKIPIRPLRVQADGTESVGEGAKKDVLVVSDSEGNWRPFKPDTPQDFSEYGLWRDQSTQKTVKKGGLSGLFGGTKTVQEGPNGKIEPHEVRGLQFAGAESKEVYRDAPLPPEVQAKPWQAEHYEVRLHFGEDGNLVGGQSTIKGKAKEKTDKLPLDLGGFPSSVFVNEGLTKPLSHSHADGQLLIDKSLDAGEEFAVTVGFQGTPQADSHPAVPGDVGWLASDDATVTMNGVENASTWMPTDNDPSNKASYDFHLTVPEGHFAVANGELVGSKKTKTGTEYHYRSKERMASYLASVNVFDSAKYTTTKVSEDFEVVHPRGMEQKVDSEFQRHDEMMDYLSERLGPYPFSSYGAIVTDLPADKTTLLFHDGDDTFSREEKISLAFEAQTRSIFDKDSIQGHGGHEGTIFHELAHQWLGNSVTKASVQDIWVTEAFPSYSDNLWYEQDGNEEWVKENMKSIHANLKGHTFTDTMAKPDRDKLFSQENYGRMKLSMHAMRKELGDEQFFATMKSVVTQYKDKSVSTEQMAASMNEFNDGKLTEFFNNWLHSTTVPDMQF